LALPVGTQGQEPASPMNGMIRYSTTANDVEAYIAGAWTTLTTGGSTAAITLGTSAATPDPASSYSATTGLFSGASGQVSVTSTGNEIARFTGTGVSIGTTYVSTTAPTNGLLVQGNVGIGTTSPLALLDVNASGSSNLQVDTFNGTASLTLNNTNNGFPVVLSRPNADAIGILTITSNRNASTPGFAVNVTGGSGVRDLFAVQEGGTNRFYIQNGGNVGVGTTAPDALLSLGGQSARTIDMVRETTASTAGNNLTLQAGGATPLGTDKAGGSLVLSSGISTGTGSSGINFNIYKAAGSSGSADNAASTAMTITGAGNVGIGTTAPSSKFQVGSGTFADNQIATFHAGTNNNLLISLQSAFSNGIRLLSANDADNAYLPMELDASTFDFVGGNVGIGTTTPSDANGATALQVKGATGTDQLSVTDGTRTFGVNLNAGGGVAHVQFGSVSNDDVGIFVNNGAPKLTVQASSGNVGIGTNAPAYLLHVGSPSAVGVVADFQNSSGYCTFSPSANGILTTCTSDVRLKKDIVDTGDALAWLGTMRIRDFTLRATGERRTGVIAQEMMKVHPEMVRMGATGFYQADVPDAWKLIKAIQELKAANDDLVTRIGAEDNALKSANDNIADLRASFEAYKDAHP
jgi:Chaperone of endosialidase